MDNSKFNLWRACFSFCFIDGVLDAAERKWIDEKLKILPFSEAQKSILHTDLKAVPELKEILPLITSPADRGFLVNNLRYLAKLDNELSDVESATIESVLKVVMAKIDPEAAKRLIEDLQKKS